MLLLISTVLALAIVTIYYEWHAIYYKFIRKKNTRYWVNYNANPNKNNVGDCAIRAAAKVIHVPWDNVFDSFAAIAKKFKVTMDCNAVLERYLKLHKFEEIQIIPPKNWVKKKFGYISFYSFAQTHKKGTYVLIGRHDDLSESMHAVALVNGKLYDTFDSGSYEVLRVFKKV